MLSRVILLSMTLIISQSDYGATHSDTTWLVVQQGAATERRQNTSSTPATRQADRAGKSDRATGVNKRTSRPFKPSEKIAPDQAVAFPVDT
jgi:hypothetical protein